MADLGGEGVAGKQVITRDELRQVLQEQIGKRPKVKIEDFENWSGSQKINWILAVTPENVSDVQAVVKGARAVGLKVRCAASKHSWSPVFSDEGNILVYTHKIRRPDGPQIKLEDEDPDYPDKRLVTIAAGVKNKDFLKFQLKNNVCMPTNTIIRQVTAGGIVGGGCHGTGWDLKSISDYVVRMRIVNSDGDLVEYSMKKDEDMMKAVQCSLGMFGITIDLAFKLDPTMPQVMTENRWIKMGKLFYEPGVLRKIVQDNWSVEIFWFPFNGIDSSEAVEAWVDKDVDYDDWDPKNDEALVRIINPTTEGGDDVDSAVYKGESVVCWWMNVLGNIIDGIVLRHPQVTPGFMRSQINFLKDQYEEGRYKQEMAHAVHFRDHVDGIKCNGLEWCFNVSDDVSNVCTATQKVVEMVRNEAQKGNFPLNLPIEMRFIADSDAYLVPAGSANPANGGTGHSVYIEVVSLIETPGWEDFIQRVTDVWSQEKGARPHWCKEWSSLKGIDAFIRKAYSKEIPMYLKNLESSRADPDGIFFNDRLEEIFYPKGHPGKRNFPYMVIPGEKKSGICSVL